MENKRIKGIIEAVLFAFGEPVKLSQLAAACEATEFELQVVLAQMEADYESEDRGIRLIRLENAYQLVTKAEYYPNLITIASHPEKPRLTDVLMETLSIIAYKQPITKSEIEKIRGVSSDHAVNRLVEYNLIQEVGRLDAPGRPILFGTTDEFLRRFGLESKSMLPEDDFEPELSEEDVEI
ncbi:MAG: SMC-Scp complex subunit ScpB [Eubacterium sp.]|nr:SMC-Scp complex subunit ScpB [Eubacterium sp.]